MRAASFETRRGEIETYFDRTAADLWARLTSDAPLGRIRATVRAGRDSMRGTLLGWLPQDLQGARLLDAGCGTGALAVEAARRGAAVVAVDVAPTLVGLARERMPRDVTVSGSGAPGSIDFRVGDMLSADLGRFDYAVAMDSLIHYRAEDAVRAVTALAARTGSALLFTFAPRTPALSAMHAVGQLFPRGDRAPAIEPVAESALRRRLGDALPAPWALGRAHRVVSGFYLSQAQELRRA